MNGRFLVFSPLPFLTSIDDGSVTTGHVSFLRYGVGTSWLVTTQRIFISFDHYISLSKHDFLSEKKAV